MRVDTYDGRASPDFCDLVVRERENGDWKESADHVLSHALVWLVKHAVNCITGLQGFTLEV